MAKQNAAPRPDFENGATGTGNDARLALYDQIADQNDGLRAEDFEDVTDDMYSTRAARRSGGADDSELEAADSDGEALGEPADDGSDVGPGEDAPRVPTIRVNGQDIELTAERIAHYQKVAAGDEYLAEASKIFKQASAPPAEPEPEPFDDYALARAIQMGSEDEAVEAIQRLRKATTLPTGEIEQVVAQALAKRDVQTDSERFRTDYRDLLANEEARDAIYAFDAMYASEGEAPTYERFKKAAQRVEKLRGNAAASMDEKVARKAAAPRAVVGGSARPAPQPEEREPTDREVIAAIAKARGQQIMQAGN